MEFFWLAVFAITVSVIIRYNKQKQQERDALAERQTYEHMVCPLLITSNYPNDPTVLMRAEAERQKLRAAGNKYSETLPIVAYPFAFGANGQGGINTWLAYRSNCMLKEQQLIAEFMAKIEAENPALNNQFILNQSPN